jgi:hypothetical protein
MGTDRQTDDTEANTIARPLYLFITIVLIKEGRANDGSHAVIMYSLYFSSQFIRGKLISNYEYISITTNFI